MEIEKKVIRFIELSEKFSKTEDEAIGKEKDLLNSFKKQPYGWASGFIGSGSGDITIQRQEQVVEESLEVLAERMITKIREYEEYKQLQKDLTEYFKAKQKLNN